MKTIDRFMAKVEKTDSCWLWTACKTPQGYGRFFFDGGNKLSNRVAFELFVGPVGQFHVLHKCDNPSCVNPAHLFLGTNADNVADKVAKGRVPSAVGVLNSHARLTPIDVIEIRKAHADGEQRSKIAKRFGIAPAYVNQISAKQAWRHI
jgi:hypothetical protein